MLSFSTFTSSSQSNPNDTTTKKPLKFYNKSIEKDSNYSEGYGIQISEQTVSTESKLRRSELTNYKMPQELGTLPFSTTPGRGVSNPLLSQEATRENKSCQPSSENFYNRSFTIFNQAPDISKHVQANSSYRQGISTRSLNKTTYNSK